MRRIGLAVVFALSLTVAPLAAAAQQMAKVPRIGVLVPAEPEAPNEPNIAAFRQGLRDLGYVNGQNIAVEYRWAHGKAERYSALVAELVRLDLNLIVIGSGVALLAARHVTQTLPVVGVGMGGDPVATGLVVSLARPGGNITGVTGIIDAGFVAKWAELLKEAAPGISRVGYLYDPSSPVSRRRLPDLQNATRALSLRLLDLPVQDANRIDHVLNALSSKEGNNGLIVVAEASFFPHRNRICEFALKHRLPAIYSFRLFVDAGGLMSYSYSLPELWQRAAAHVDKILKGAKPADLPVEQPTKFELIINLKTAKAIGLTIPQSILVRADELIQ
jgi:putative tryptophan/tyrosine transport system substrate-binding protein